MNIFLKLRRLALNARKWVFRELDLVRAPQALGIAPSPQAPWVVAGLFETSSGIGEIARLEFLRLSKQRPNVFAYNLSPLLKQQDIKGDFDFIDKLPDVDEGTVLIVMNGPNLPKALMDVFPKGNKHWRVIAHWSWELSVFPKGWQKCFPLTDEIWVPSRFVAEALQRHDAPPIHVQIPEIDIPIEIASRRSVFGLSDSKFIVIALADSFSSFNRKNPAGAVEAFKKAFSESDKATLVLKLRNYDVRLGSVILMGLPVKRVKILTSSLSHREKIQLIMCADVLVSLHRAEGFGLTIAEAMALGVPVVATDWSANAEFMKPENGYLVPCHLVPVRDPKGPYRGYKNAVWAEPDTEAAALALRKLYEEWQQRQQSKNMNGVS